MVKMFLAILCVAYIIQNVTSLIMNAIQDEISKKDKEVE